MQCLIYKILIIVSSEKSMLGCAGIERISGVHAHEFPDTKTALACDGSLLQIFKNKSEIAVL